MKVNLTKFGPVNNIIEDHLVHKSHIILEVVNDEITVYVCDGDKETKLSKSYDSIWIGKEGKLLHAVSPTGGFTKNASIQFLKGKFICYSAKNPRTKKRTTSVLEANTLDIREMVI